MRWLALAIVAAAGLAEAGPTADDIRAEVRHDWNGDGLSDRAVLAPGEIDLDLWIFWGAPGGGESLAVRARDVVWGGAMMGTEPSLEVTGRGSLQVLSQNDSIGRNRWYETLTVAYRDGRFLVAGFTHEARNTLDLDYGLACDINLLTGRGVVNEREVRSPVRASPVETWSLEERPAFESLCPGAG